MEQKPKLLAVIALLQDIPKYRLVKGQVGTIVEYLDEDVFEVEFSDNEGRSYASIALSTNQFLILHYEPAQVA